MSSTMFYLLFIPLLAFILLTVNLIFAPHNPYKEKNSAFECGFSSFLGQSRTQFSISFFIFALLFLLFDLEILLVYPYLVSSYTNEAYGLTIVLIFLTALTLGFAFELGKKALSFDSRQTTDNGKGVYFNLVMIDNAQSNANPSVSLVKKRTFSTSALMLTDDNESLSKRKAESSPDAADLSSSIGEASHSAKRIRTIEDPYTEKDQNKPETSQNEAHNSENRPHSNRILDQRADGVPLFDSLDGYSGPTGYGVRKIDDEYEEDVVRGFRERYGKTSEEREEYIEKIVSSDDPKYVAHMASKHLDSRAKDFSELQMDGEAGGPLEKAMAKIDDFETRLEDSIAARDLELSDPKEFSEGKNSVDSRSTNCPSNNSPEGNEGSTFNTSGDSNGGETETDFTSTWVHKKIGLSPEADYLPKLNTTDELLNTKTLDKIEQGMKDKLSSSDVKMVDEELEKASEQRDLMRTAQHPEHWLSTSELSTTRGSINYGHDYNAINSKYIDALEKRTQELLSEEAKDIEPLTNDNLNLVKPLIDEILSREAKYGKPPLDEYDINEPSEKDDFDSEENSTSSQENSSNDEDENSSNGDQKGSFNDNQENSSNDKQENSSKYDQEGSSNNNQKTSFDVDQNNSDSNKVNKNPTNQTPTEYVQSIQETEPMDLIDYDS